MSEQVSPLLCGLRAVVESAAAADVRQPQQLRAVIQGYLDVLEAHRMLVAVIVGGPAGASSESAALVRDAIRALRDELARGGGPGPDHRIRAASALGAVQAAVLEVTDVDPATVRDVVTDAAVAILLS